jgi:hypothetical protein
MNAYLPVSTYVPYNPYLPILSESASGENIGCRLTSCAAWMSNDSGKTGGGAGGALDPTPEGMLSMLRGRSSMLTGKTGTAAVAFGAPSSEDGLIGAGSTVLKLDKLVAFCRLLDRAVNLEEGGLSNKESKSVCFVGGFSVGPAFSWAFSSSESEDRSGSQGSVKGRVSGCEST